MKIFTFLVLLLTLDFSCSQKLFKAFNTTALTKYRADLNKASSNLKLNVAAPQVPREDLGRIEGMCVNRTDVDYFRDPDNVKFRCDVVFRCERPGRGFIPVDGVSGIRLVRVQCPSGNSLYPNFKLLYFMVPLVSHDLVFLNESCLFFC